MNTNTRRDVRGAVAHLIATAPVPPADHTLGRLYAEVDARQRTQELRRLDANAILIMLGRLWPFGGITRARQSLPSRREEAVLSVLSDHAGAWLEAYEVAALLSSRTASRDGESTAFGTLYRQLRMLTDKGLVDRQEDESPDAVSLCRRYRVNAEGLVKLAAARQAGRRAWWVRLNARMGDATSSTATKG